jgi:hypothetical protein
VRRVVLLYGLILSLACVFQKSTICEWARYERADVVSDQCYDWEKKNAYLSAYGVMKSAEFLKTFVDYPSQPPASFSIDQIEKDVERRSKAAWH